MYTLPHLFGGQDHLKQADSFAVLVGGNMLDVLSTRAVSEIMSAALVLGKRTDMMAMSSLTCRSG